MSRDEFHVRTSGRSAGGHPARPGPPPADPRRAPRARHGGPGDSGGTGPGEPARPLDELFRAAARRWPDVVAVRDVTAELTYSQLATAAAAQARHLHETGVRRGDAVLIGAPRSVAEVVAVVGTVWAGAAYVGIDPEWPPAHLAAIVARCAPTALLSGHEPPAGPLRGVALAGTWTADRPPDGPAPTPDRPVDAESVAYIAFTSGSTGRPKGVRVPHRAVPRLVLGADYVRLHPGERMLRLSPLAFDASTFEIWGALLTGATLEIFPPDPPSPSDLGDFLTERRVTVAWFTAGLFRLLVDFAPDGLGGLRHLLTGGDVVPHEHVARALARHPALTVTNGYGPTENTTFSTTHTVSRPEEIDGPLPIGTPVPGTRVHVLDDRGHPVPPGTVGELHLAGDGLALDYLDDPTETARYFGHFSPDVPERLYRTGDLVRADAAGRLHFLGRADDQVKLRGYRVEPQAISALLTGHPGVRDALVFATGGDSASKRLVAAVVREPGARPDPGALRTMLAATLPAYLVPTRWTVVDALPLTDNGKVDRRALLASTVTVT